MFRAANVDVEHRPPGAPAESVHAADVDDGGHARARGGDGGGVAQIATGNRHAFSEQAVGFGGIAAKNADRGAAVQ